MLVSRPGIDPGLDRELRAVEDYSCVSRPVFSNPPRKHSNRTIQWGDELHRFVQVRVLLQALKVLRALRGSSCCIQPETGDRRPGHKEHEGHEDHEAIFSLEPLSKPRRLTLTGIGRQSDSTDTRPASS